MRLRYRGIDYESYHSLVKVSRQNRTATFRGCSYKLTESTIYLTIQSQDNFVNHRVSGFVSEDVPGHFLGHFDAFKQIQFVEAIPTYFLDEKAPVEV